MNRTIKLDQRPDGWWYNCCHGIVETGWQFGGQTHADAVAQAKVRFGSDYEVAPGSQLVNGRTQDYWDWLFKAACGPLPKL